MKREFFRPDEVADKLGISRRSVYRLIQEAALVAFSVRAGKIKFRIVMGYPVSPQEVYRGIRQRCIAVLGALAPVHVDELALSIDIGYLQKEAFLQSQTAGIDGGKKHEIVKSRHLFKDAIDLLAGQNTRQTPFGLSFENA